MHARIFICTLTAFMMLALFGHAEGGSGDGKLDVYYIDVEGGAATLIVTPAGESVLVDTGNPGERDAGRIFAAAQARELSGLIMSSLRTITAITSAGSPGFPP